MAKEPEQVTDQEGHVPEVVTREQYDALLKQAQEAIAEANHRISILENDKRILQETLNVQNKLVEKLLNSDKK